MSFDIVNILALISCVVTIVFAYKIVTEMSAARRQQRIKMVDDRQLASEKSEYKKILEATHWLEHERQRNKGEHFEDETVYLNRAQAIRTSTAFFSLVNE